MSVFNQTLVITPPERVRFKNGEVFSAKGFTCPECNGKGEFVKEMEKDVHASNPCPVCRGAGKLQAKIVVGWSPEIL